MDDLLDDVLITEGWSGIWGFFGRAALLWLRVVEVDCGGPLSRGVAQLDVDVDGCDHGDEVCVGDAFCDCVGPALCSVDDLKCKFKGLGRGAQRSPSEHAEGGHLAVCAPIAKL